MEWPKMKKGIPKGHPAHQPLEAHYDSIVDESSTELTWGSCNVS
jgi:hypothetical protein